MLQLKKENKCITIMYAVVFLMFLIIGYLVPYVHDDWAWGTQIGIERLESLFENYNGRWMGNLVVLLITRVRCIRAIFYGAAFFFITYYSMKISNSNKWQSVAAFLALMLCIPTGVFRQAIGWTAGFANYVMGIAVALPVIYIIMKKIEDSEDRAFKWTDIGYVLLCFCGQLFVEHVTTYMLFLVVASNILYFFKKRKCNSLMLMLMASGIGGAILMFSNGSYAIAAGGDGQYQDIKIQSSLFSTLKQAIDTLLSSVCEYLILAPVVISLLLGIMCIIILMKLKERFYIPAVVVITAFCLYQIFRGYMPYDLSIFAYGEYVEGFFCLSYLLTVAYTVFLVKEIRWKGLFAISSILILAAPLVMASPIGPRNFFPMYVFYIILFILIYEYLVKSSEKLEIAIGKVIVIACVLLSIYYMAIVSFTFFSETKRMKSIDKQVNAEKSEIQLYTLPFAEYYHFSTPVNSVFASRFKLFYGIPQETTVVFKPFKSRFFE